MEARMIPHGREDRRAGRRMAAVAWRPVLVYALRPSGAPLIPPRGHEPSAGRPGFRALPRARRFRGWMLPQTRAAP